VARPLRVEYPGAVYHVISRGNAGEDIFDSKRDREKFLEYIGKAAERFSIIIHTYCLMNNHYHLLLETPQSNLSVAIHWLNTSYAAYYNIKHERNGHLFQGRFKALLIDAAEYLKELSRYIHLNPVRARIVAKPIDYKWSSYPAFMGTTKKPDWLETGWSLGNFGKTKKEAIKYYRSFVEQVDTEALENPSKYLVGGFILGDDEFVAWVKDTFLSSREDEKEIPQLKTLKPKVSLKRILEFICDEFGCSKERIIEKGRKRNKAREIAIYLSRDLGGKSCKDLGSFFGGISGSAVTMRYNQTAKEMAHDKRMGNKVNKIKKRIVNI
jgi:REP element-mobilizing transposase RayT